MKVMIAVESSDYSKAAIDKFCKMFAGSIISDIRIISVVRPIVMPAEPYALSPEYIQSLTDAEENEANETVEKAREEIQRRLPNLETVITTIVVTGTPEQIIVEEAERWRADLIILGSHGHGFWKRAWLGSVSNGVVHHAPCSVLVVRKDD
jgi:nucleotide-binding universal stress UspA family protein